MTSTPLPLFFLLAACMGPGATDDDRPPTDPTNDTATNETRPDDTGNTGTNDVVPAELTGATALLNTEHETVAHVSWNQSEDADVHLEFSFEKDIWATSPVRSLTAGDHEELILGVPYDVDVSWRIVADNAGGVTTTPEQSIRTGPVPDYPPNEVRVADAAAWDTDMEYIFVAVSQGSWIGSRGWTMLVDREGRVVWAHRSPSGTNTMHPRLSVNEDAFLIDHSTYFSSFDLTGSEIVELKIDGTEERTWAVPGQHHPFTQLPDGSIAYNAYRGPNVSRPEDDVLVVVDPAGKARDVFGCDAFVSSLGANPSNSGFNYCGSNTLSFSPSRDAFLYSIFTHDTVVEVDAITGAATRWFGDISGSYTFGPADSQFWYQHGAYYTDDDTLLVSTHSTESSSSDLAVREYEIDDKAEELVQIYAAGIGSGVPGRQMGEAHRLPGGNTLHNFGTNAMVREYDPAGNVVWDLRWEDAQYFGNLEHAVGRSAPVTNSLYDYAPLQP